MRCQICEEKFDYSKNCPFVLIPCTHTLCVQCLLKLESKHCPFCSAEIVDRNPNWSLIEMVSESSYDKLKPKVDFLVAETLHLKLTLNENHEKKLKEYQTQFQTIRNQIIIQTNQMVSLIHKRQKELLGQVRELENSVNKKLNSLFVDDRVHDEACEAQQMLLNNEPNLLQLEKLKAEYHLKNMDLNLKLIDSEKSCQYLFEFVPNFNFEISVQSIGIVRARNQVGLIYFCNFTKIQIGFQIY